ncbi:MAG: hypothetical protein F6K47_32175, partial [Symploca sp. SIO2E6]|nr:hypothetical protein [Symploca sp. SIO2E6]
PTFPPVINASIIFNLRDSYQEDTTGKELQRVTFSYACACTHLESILVALSNGLGYFLSESLVANGSRTLKLGGLFVRALGDRTDSLTRSSATLIDEEDKIYQGLWVEQNLILGCLQATASAALSWFSEQFNDGETLSTFLDICSRSAQVDQELYNYIYSVYNYGEHESRNILARDGEATSGVGARTKDITEDTKDLVNEIKNLKKILFKKERPKKLLKYLDNYQTRLDQKNLLAQTTLTYAYLSQGELERAHEKLVDLRNKLYRGELTKTSSRHLIPTTILYEASRMFFDLMVDHKNFLREQEWRSGSSIEILQEPIQELSEYAEKHNTGIIDFDVYLAASLFWHVFGLAEFYACPSNKKKSLKSAIDKFIKSGHYSAQIGHRQRAVRCLCYSSRLYSRLGNLEAAQQLIESARKLLFKPGVKFTSCNASYHIFIAEGERLWSELLVEQQNLQSPDSEKLMNILCYFVTAWEKSKLHGSLRSQADSLYNIYRVIEKLSERSNEQIQVVVEEFSQRADLEKKELLLAESSNNRSYRNICQEIFSDELLKSKSTCKESSVALKNQVKEFWNRGTQASEQGARVHLFSTMIDNGTFMAVVT